MADRMPFQTPIPHPLSVRPDEWRGLTSARAGVITPLAFFPLLREDRARGRVIVSLRMEETLQLLANPVRVTVCAHLIPKICEERFNGSIETFNRAYRGEKMPDGSDAPVVFPGYTPVSGQNDKGLEILDKLGVHYKEGKPIIRDVIRAYNIMVNSRRRAMSKALPLRTEVDDTLAQAFWSHPNLSYIKASFDAAMMEGAVNMTLDGFAPVKGLGIQTSYASVATSFRETGGGSFSGPGYNVRENPTGAGEAQMRVEEDGDKAGWPAIYAELAQANVVLSLANLEMARRTQAFAKMRERYDGIADEYLIDMLMRGVRVPPEDLREPVLLARQQTVIGMTERFATDAENLDVSVANGRATMGLTINTPAVNTGGVILVTAEIVPEALFERIEDGFIHLSGVNDLPDYLEDTLDPQKVEVVKNSYVDIFHSAPSAVFGYAPLNHEWRRSFARVGGRFKRPVSNVWKEDRTRIWSMDVTDPVLSEDFYLCPSPFPHTPFADTNSDPFEITTLGNLEIVGLTVFGAGFEENNDHYEKIMADIEQKRLKQVPPGSEELPEEEAVVEKTSDAAKGKVVKDASE